MNIVNEKTDLVLKLEDLHVAYRIRNQWVNVVRGVSLNIKRGETFGVVGESGCGKSTTAYAIVRYMGRNGKVTKGKIQFNGEDIRYKSMSELQAIRGSRISMVYQDPQAALNPSMRVGKQIAEVLQLHENVDYHTAWEKSLAVLESVHMPDPNRVMKRYPHQLSGGMQQRVVIAMALIANPDLLIMDEPTTGLDVTTQAAVLDLINELKQIYDSAILYISHDLSVIAQVCDRVGVMYAGQMVEKGEVDEIFNRPRHPYTLDLLGCIPRFDKNYHAGISLSSIKGRVPPPTQIPTGCIYEPRCRFAQDICRKEQPALNSDDNGHKTRCFFDRDVLEEGIIEEEHKIQSMAEHMPEKQRKAHKLLEVKDLKKYYGGGQKKFILFGEQQPFTKAVNGVQFTVREGETFSLVGESGCGKTTLGRCVVGLLTPSDGQIIFRENDVTDSASNRSTQQRSDMQIIFQHPHSSLNPQYKIGQIIGRTLTLFGIKDKQERQQRTIELLEAVSLDANYFHRHATQLSGGEKQRVAIARAFAGNPSLVVCDEAVSSLDVSVQASILNLLVDLKHKQHCAYLFISHDLSVVQYISDSIGVMYLGKLMEIGTTEQVFKLPSHPYTEALLSAAQSPGQSEIQPIRLEGSVPSPSKPPAGCPFNTRCHRKIGDICEKETPPWQDMGNDHFIFCHIPMKTD